MTTTYKLIASQTLYSNTATINFSNIPTSGYTDLLIDISFRNTAAGSGGAIRFNGDTGDNYNWLSLSGSAGSVASNNAPAFVSSGYPLFDNLLLYPNVPSTATADVFSNCQIYIPDAFGNTSKSVLIESVATGMDSTVYVLALYAGRWSGTSPISSINLLIDPYASGSPILQAGSSVSIYGITKKDAPIISGESTFGIQATGGDEVFIANGYKVHVFKSSGTFNVTSPGFVEHLVIAGGGGGGASFAGGGGAGGYRSSVANENSGGGSITEPKKLINAGSYPVIVGAGGTGGSTLNVSPYTNTTATAGSQSSLIDIISVGGGRSPYQAYADDPSQAAGGSGAGGNGPSNGTRRGGFGISGQGNNGGSGISGGISTTFTGGGGGAGSVGGTAVGTVSGNGGNGLASSITGTSVTRAGGGGGGLGNTGTPGTGGSGGGGNASTAYGISGQSGTVNTGSGGGGGSYFSNQHQSGGNGGSGIVIIRYPVS